MRNRTAIIAFDALSHPIRLKIFRRLLKKADQGVTATALCEKLEIAPATLSFHMSKLINCELVNVEKDGRWVVYTVNYNQFRHLIMFLIEKGDPKLMKFDFSVYEKDSDADITE